MFCSHCMHGVFYLQICCNKLSYCNMTTIQSILSEQSLRVTKPRVAVFEALERASEPVSLRSLVEALPGIDRVSIYRTLELFEQLRIITVVHIGWKKRYELAAAHQQHHHHHLVCTQCGSITEINSERLEDVIYTLTGSHGFTPTGHTFEITGICNTCHR